MPLWWGNENLEEIISFSFYFLGLEGWYDSDLTFGVVEEDIMEFFLPNILIFSTLPVVVGGGESITSMAGL